MQELQVKWPYIVEETNKFYFNHIDLGNGTMFRMGICKRFAPRSLLFVGIERIGCYSFSSSIFLHKNYVREKLNLQGDAGAIADFLNAQLQIEVKQQGEYIESILLGIEPYGLLGENHLMPWHPVIIEEPK